MRSDKPYFFSNTGEFLFDICRLLGYKYSSNRYYRGNKIMENLQSQCRVYVCVEEANNHDLDSLGHAFILGMKLKTSDQRVLNNIDAYGPALLDSIERDEKGNLKIWTYSLYPEFSPQGSVTINDNRDMRRAERILFGRDGVPHSFDGFVCKIIDTNLFDRMLVTTPSYMCEVERALRSCEYNLVLANCIKFAADQFALITKIRFQTATKLGIEFLGLTVDGYLPETLLREVKTFKNDRKFNPEAARISRLDVRDISSQQMFDMITGDDAKWAAYEADSISEPNKPETPIQVNSNQDLGDPFADQWAALDAEIAKR
jgi:hypothetical protein